MARRRAVAPPQRHPAVVKAEFEEMLDQAHRNGWGDKLNCTGRESEFVDYVEPPTVQFADNACNGCPLLSLCREYGDATRPAVGIYGNKAWSYGRSLHWAGNLAGEDDTDADGFFDPEHEWPIDWRAREAALKTAPQDQD